MPKSTELKAGDKVRVRQGVIGKKIEEGFMSDFLEKRYRLIGLHPGIGVITHTNVAKNNLGSVAVTFTHLEVSPLSLKFFPNELQLVARVK